MNKLNTDKLQQHTLEVLKMVENLGLIVVALIGDGLSSNVSLFKRFGGGVLKSMVPNPANPQRTLFLLLDPVHICKNVYNNFQRRKRFVYPQMLECQGNYPDMESFCKGTTAHFE